MMSSTRQVAVRGTGRRPFLASLAAAVAAPAFPILPLQARAAPLGDLVLFGPPAGPSITLAHGVASGAFGAIADSPSFQVWRNPDELRAGLTSGTMSVFVAPVQVAANLYNRGLGVRLVNVMTNGLLYVIATDPGIAVVGDLRGRTLAVPFRNDMPDLILSGLLARHGLAVGADLAVVSAGSPVEAIQMVVLGRADAALVPEPAATAAIANGPMFGAEIRRAIDVQQAWGEATGHAPVLPQAGLAVTEAFLADHPGVADALQDAAAAATAAVAADPQGAAAHAAAALGLPQSVIAAAIPHSNLVAIRASEARPAIEAMLSDMTDADAGIIGGGLPDAAFYL